MIAYDKKASKKKTNVFGLRSRKLKTFSSLTRLRPEILYVLFVASPNQFHNFFLNFYSIFDQNRNLMMEFHEFKDIITTMAMEKNLGMKKIQSIIDILTLDEPFTSDTLDQDTLQTMFDTIKESSKDKVEDKVVVDFLKFLPILLSFYSEMTINQIKLRKSKLDVSLMKGIEKRKGGEEKPIKNIYSLNTILEEMGIKYIGSENSSILSYRDIENVLLKFKNLQSWITYDIIKQIMESLEKKMKVEVRTKIEKKRMKLKKVLNYLALKLCIHENCSVAKYTNKSADFQNYFEIVLMWHSAYHSHVLKEEGTRLSKNFEEFIQKITRKNRLGDENITFQRLVSILQGFFKKYFPLFPKDDVSKVARKFSLCKQTDFYLHDDIPLSVVQKELFEMIVNYCDDKFQLYIQKTYNGVKKRNDKIKIEKYQKIYQGNIYGSENSLLKINQKDIKEEEEVQLDVQEQKREDENEEGDEENEENEKLKEKFKKNVNIVQNNIMHLKDTKEQKPKDILRSCFLMESFLEKYVNSRKGQFKNQNSKQIFQRETYGEEGFNENIINSQRLSEEDEERENQEQEEEKKRREEEKLMKKKEEEEKKKIEEEKQKVEDLKKEQERIKQNDLFQKNQAKGAKGILQLVRGTNQAAYGTSNIKRVEEEEKKKKLNIETKEKVKDITQDIKAKVQIVDKVKIIQSAF